MSFVKQFLLYGVAGAASRLAAIVLVPLYTHSLTVAQYGQLEVLLAVHALVVIVGGLQTESAVARDCHQATQAGQARRLAWTALILTVAGTALVSLALWGAALIGHLPSAVSGRTLLLLLALTGPVQLLGIQLILLRFGGSALFFALLSFSDLTLCALFSLWFIAGMHLGIDGALLGILCGKLVCVGLAWGPTLGTPRQVRPSRALAKSMLAYGVPALPAVLVNWLQNAGSRLLLAMALTLDDVALAGIAIKVAALYAFVVYSFRLAWEPYAMARLADVDSDPQVFNRTLEWYVASMFLIAGLALMLGPYVVALLAPPAYAPGGSIAALFIMGQFWVGMTNLLVIGIHGARRTSRLLPVYAGGVLVNVALLLSTAPLVGVAAAGLGFLLGSVCSALLAAYYSNRLFNTRFDRKLIGWALLSTTLLLAAWYPVLVHHQAKIASPASAAALLAAGLALLLGLLALTLVFGFGKGRPSAMWSVLRSAVLARIQPT